jgi:hypothetical protein
MNKTSRRNDIENYSKDGSAWNLFQRANPTYMKGDD